MDSEGHEPEAGDSAPDGSAKAPEETVPAPDESAETPEAAASGDDERESLGVAPAADEPPTKDASPRPAGRRRSGKAALRRQWRRGLEGDYVACLVRSIPEDPNGFYTPDVLEGLDRDAWNAVNGPWEEASVALGATIAGRLLGASLDLVPDRHRWRTLVHIPGEGGLLSPESWREPGRCLIAARASFAADVVDEARIWRIAGEIGLDADALRDLVRQLSRKPEADPTGDIDATGGGAA